MIPLQPGVAHRRGRGVALLFHERGTRRGWVFSSTPRPKFTPRKDPVHILQEVGWAPRPVRTGGKSRPHRDSIPDLPARSQSLYRLSYPAHNKNWFLLLIKRYNLFEVLACSTSFFHFSLSWATFFQLRTFIFFISTKTSSSHRNLGLPVGLLRTNLVFVNVNWRYYLRYLQIKVRIVKADLKEIGPVGGLL